MRVLWLAIGAVLVGVAGALGSVYLEFAGVPAQFEPHNRPAAQTEVAGPGSSTGVPKAVVVNGQDHDFGSGQRQSKMAHEFVITNEGSAPLKLEKGPTSCKCTMSDLQKGQLLTGEQAVVKLEWTLTTIADRFRQTAEIHTNDPTLPTILLTIHGKVVDLVRLEPAELVLSHVSASEGTQAEFRVYGFQTKDLQVVRHEFVHQETAAQFDVQLAPLAPAELAAKPDASCGLRGVLTLKPGLPLGPINQTIRLTTNVTEAQTFELNVTGSVVSDLSIVGPHLFDEEHNVLRFGTVRRSQGAQAALRVLVKGPYRRDVRLRVKEVDPADALQVTVGAAQEINAGAVFMFPLQVEIPKNVRPVDRLGGEEGKFGRIAIATTHPDVPVVYVHVRFAVKEEM